MTRRISFTVHGDVQGVNFRSFTQKKATAYGLTGFVKNTSSGAVQGEAQGPDEGLQKLLKDINRGPSAARVVKVEKAEVEVSEGEGEGEGEGGFVAM